MRYGRILGPIDPAQVPTPEVGINEFIDENDLLLYGKDTDGVVRLLSTGGSSSFKSQAVNTGTADDVLVAIDGVVAYNTGDVYYITLPETNTGPMTIDINTIGVQDIQFLGNLALDVPVAGIMAGTVNAFVYDGTDFQWIGMVDGDKVALEATVGFADIQGVGVTASEALNFLVLPGGAVVQNMAVWATIDFAGGASTAVTMAGINVESAESMFGGTVDVFTGAVAAGEGGVSRGISFAGVIPAITGIQTYRLTAVVTTDTWANITAGEMLINVQWSNQ